MLGPLGLGRLVELLPAVPRRAPGMPAGQLVQTLGTTTREPLDLLSHRWIAAPAFLASPARKILNEVTIASAIKVRIQGMAGLSRAIVFQTSMHRRISRVALVPTTELLLQTVATDKPDRQESAVRQILKRHGERLLGLLDDPPKERQGLLGLADLDQKDAEVIEAAGQVAAGQGGARTEPDERLPERERLLISVQRPGPVASSL